MSAKHKFLIGGAVVCCLGAHEASARHVLDNGRVHVVLADTSGGLAGTDADRVDEIHWINSRGVSTGNLASNGGPLHCNDPQEFFGQAYGDSGNATPYFIIGGVRSKWTGIAGSKLGGSSSVTALTTCDNTLDGTTRTQYSLSTTPGLVNQIRIVRTFTFKTTETSGTLRAYVPRLSFARFRTVLIPDSTGAVQKIDAGNCAGNCEVTNWNGRWVADDDGAGNGLVILRNPARGPAALVVVDNDSFSASNNTAVGLKQPASGWSGAVRETEALCFYDAASWPASRQAAGQPPRGCRAP